MLVRFRTGCFVPHFFEVIQHCGSLPVRCFSTFKHPMTTRLRKQQEDTNYRILRLLEENPNLSQRELAKALGLSLGGLNYCLQALLDKGVVKMHNFQNSQRKAAYAYLLTPSGIAEKAALTGRFLKRKMEEYEALKAEIESLQMEAAQTKMADNSTKHAP